MYNISIWHLVVSVLDLGAAETWHYWSTALHMWTPNVPRGMPPQGVWIYYQTMMHVAGRAQEDVVRNNSRLHMPDDCFILYKKY